MRAGNDTKRTASGRLDDGIAEYLGMSRASTGRESAVQPACSLGPSGSGHAPDDLFDSVSQGQQIAVTTGGRIKLEAEWKPF